jgi:hypothetical protein
MGTSSRRLMATESGRMEKVSTAKMQRVWFKGERWSELAGQEVKMLEVAVEVERTRILRVYSVLPYRTRFDADGRPHPDNITQAHVRMRRALGSYIGQPATMDDQIAALQADASHFWEPTESQWAQAAELLGVPLDELKAARFRSTE